MFLIALHGFSIVMVESNSFSCLHGSFLTSLSLLGTFALTSLISANAVERLVPQSSRNLTTQSNSSVLGLSEFELQRIGVAAAVSFLGGVIQVSSPETGYDGRGRNRGKAASIALSF